MKGAKVQELADQDRMNFAGSCRYVKDRGDENGRDKEEARGAMIINSNRSLAEIEF